MRIQLCFLTFLVVISSVFFLFPQFSHVHLYEGKKLFFKNKSFEGEQHFMKDARGINFEVSEELDVTNTLQIQKRMLYMLSHFATLAAKHNISYWTTGGTLLGAHRHKGFIPWDADVDMCIFAKEYEKLVSVANEFPSDMWLQDHISDPRLKKTGKRLAKIRDLNSDYAGYSRHHKNWHNGIQLDLSVIRDNQRSWSPGCRPDFRKFVFPLKDIAFENLVLKGPAKTLDYLNKRYDSLEVPKVDKRMQHQGYAVFKAPIWVKKMYPALYEKLDAEQVKNN